MGRHGSGLMNGSSGRPFGQWEPYSLLNYCEFCGLYYLVLSFSGGVGHTLWLGNDTIAFLAPASGGATDGIFLGGGPFWPSFPPLQMVAGGGPHCYILSC